MNGQTLKERRSRQTLHRHKRGRGTARDELVQRFLKDSTPASFFRAADASISAVVAAPLCVCPGVTMANSTADIAFVGECE
jgi:hypothetical protein